jgi:PAS domain S-box-containing protein
VRSPASDRLADVVESANALSKVLQNQRLGATEALLLLKAITDEMDVVIFTLDQNTKVTWANRPAEELLGRSRVGMQGRGADEVGLSKFLDLHRSDVDRSQASSRKRWVVKERSFFEAGQRHRLLVISDLTLQLREEERLAWHRLIRVLSHEINNSLTPIRSLSLYLLDLLDSPERSPDWMTDLRKSLSLVASRSDSLVRFVAGYGRLAKMPAPRKSRLPLKEVLSRVAALERRVPVTVEGDPNAAVWGDPDQLEQALINIVKNAGDASLETNGGVQLVWYPVDNHVHIAIRDEGHGLSGSENLFVPFYTTKSGGSGIGLALSRQILEAHDGTITLHNRADRQGCEAIIALPRG